MKIIFFGTPYYVIPILDALQKAFKVKAEGAIQAVVTQSPKPAGRKKILEYSPVDDWAHKKGVPKFFNAADIISKKIKADIGILASYGAFIPEAVINHFPYGILVVHPSLLPQFRWASPVPAALVTNTNPTGVSVIKMDDKWDHGPVVAQFKEEISPNDTFDSLRDRLFANSAEVLTQMLPAYLKGKINLKPQNDAGASFARLITKEDAYIPPEFIKEAINPEIRKKGQKMWEVPFIKIKGKAYVQEPTAPNIERFIRAMDSWPGAWTNIRIKNTVSRLKLLKAHCGTGEDTGKLILDMVQLEGKNPVSWVIFKRGYPDMVLKK